MPVQTIPFEYLAFAIEATRGTAIAAPTHIASFLGTMKHEQTIYRPEESTGQLAQYQRSKVTRKWGSFQGAGPLDPYMLLLLLNGAVEGSVTTPATPANGVLTRDWDFTPNMTADDVETYSVFFGDPNIQIYRSAFAHLSEISFGSDATSEDAGTMSLSGMSKFPEQFASPALPSFDPGPLIAGLDMQVWMDTSSAIGTTAITGRVISANHTIPTGISQRFFAAGPTSGKNFGDIARTKRSIVTTLVLEVPDMTEVDIFEAETVVKLRIRHGGDLIESVTPDYYHHIEVDTYGPLELTDLGETADGASRTLSFQVTSEVDTTLAADFRVGVRTDKTSL